jgi:hypothetical protein
MKFGTFLNLYRYLLNIEVICSYAVGSTTLLIIF